MKKQIILLLLTLVGSALCWWPATMEPSIDFPRWILLVLIALITSLAVSLSKSYWLPFVTAATVGALGGMSTGHILFPSSDGIADSYAPIAIAVGTVVVAVVSLLAGLAARRISRSIKIPGPMTWAALLSCVAFGPVAFVLTPPLVAQRVASDDHIAEQRFTSLKTAVEQTVALNHDPASICNGRILKSHYSGPPFSNNDWDRIAGNYVKQNGYLFMVYCHEQGGYTINALPDRGKANGTLLFCTDESQKLSCGMEWNRSRNACVPCSK